MGRNGDGERYANSLPDGIFRVAAALSKGWFFNGDEKIVSTSGEAANGSIVVSL